METTSHAAPDYGTVIHRATLVRTFQAVAPALTIVCAPAGYGKSVLASQFSRLPEFDESLWVSLDGLVVGRDGLLAQVSAAFTGESAASEGMSTTLPVFPLTRADAVLCLREALAESRRRSVCVVVDGLECLHAVDDMRLLSELLQQQSSKRSRLVVTCRSLGELDSLHAGEAWLLEDRDLRLNRDEIAELVCMAKGRVADSSTIDRLQAHTGGQAALLHVLIRHDYLNDEATALPRDLVWYLDRAVRRLDDESMGALYAAALLGEGQLKELEHVLPLTPSGWLRLSAEVPLLALTEHQVAALSSFRVHSALADALSESAAARLPAEIRRHLRAEVIERLVDRGDFARIAAVLMRHGADDERVSACEVMGLSLLRTTGPATLSRLLDLLPATAVASRPVLLLLLASVLREQDSHAQAVEKASLACGLAENQGDWPTFVDASLLLCRLHLDLSDMAAVERDLQTLGHTAEGPLAPHSQCLVHAYMAVVDSYSGRKRSADCHISRVEELLERIDPASEAAVFAGNCVCGIKGNHGDWAFVVSHVQQMTLRPGLTPVQKLLLRANRAAASLEVGRLAVCRDVAEQCLAEIEQSGLHQLKACVLGTLAGALATEGDLGRAAVLHEESMDLLVTRGDIVCAATEETYWSACMRGVGRVEDALAAAESAVALLADMGDSAFLGALSAELEVAASAIALGDLGSGRSRAVTARSLSEGASAEQHVLRADMVLAEIERLEDDFEAAVGRIAAHRDYIVTGSSNWQIAMYIRAFPGLLGVFAAALGAQALPVHMLRMITPEVSVKALSIARPHLGTTEYHVLAGRFDVGRAESEDESPKAPCYVRLFGGLDVTTEYGDVTDSAWSKRKARLLFAMLAVRRGQEMPRDVILEQLWPEMDAARARNNFYVIWSAMKQALACGGKATAAAKYVRNAGGLCRVSPLVRSDLDDFEHALRALSGSETTGDVEGTLSAAQTICDLYRGDLLPGDIYEDWFTDLRDRCRQDFCDSMLSGAIAAGRKGEFGRGLGFLRRALIADPWREDLYQEAMRCQMQAGQRSAALDSYFTCRARLCDDLGIDPSGETMRLYRDILAMEEAPSDESAGDSCVDSCDGSQG